jgi:hypothetical protein
MATIAQLTQLTELRLKYNDGLTQQGLMLLTRLKQLQHLGVCETDDVTGCVLSDFVQLFRSLNENVCILACRKR